MMSRFRFVKRWFRFLALAAATFAADSASASTVPSVSGAFLAAKDLNTPYILTASWVKAASDVTFFRARVVEFRLNPDRRSIQLFDLESPGLGTMYTFPVLQKEALGYRIDLTRGLDQIYFQAPLFYPEQAAEREKSFKLYQLPVPSSVDKTFTQSDSLLSIDLKNYPYPTFEPFIKGMGPCAPLSPLSEVFCIASPDTGKNAIVKLTDVHLRLAPLKPTPGFVRKPDTRAQGVGYYATFPDAQGRSFITRRSSAEPMVWHVDAPAQMRAIVKEAVDYWNRIFGWEFIQLRDLPPGLDIWQPYVNSIVFYPNDPSGGAAGVFSALPNGQMVSGHIYVPAGFISYAESNFDYYVPRLRAEGMSERQIAEARARFTFDIQVQTVAHEIGHSLGLRHNLRAASAGKITNLETTLLSYLREDRISANENPSSSLMDYMGPDFFALIGAKIRKTNEGTLPAEALPYDEYAIRWGYSQELMPVDTHQAGPYCDLPEDLAQERFISPTDPSCGSFDEPTGMRTLRVNLGSQKAMLFGTTDQIREQCRRAWDADLLTQDAAAEILISSPATSLVLKKNDSTSFATFEEACAAVGTYIQVIYQ